MMSTLCPKCQTDTPGILKYGSYFDQKYEEISAEISDHRFVFMNHGYARLDGIEDFVGIRDEDRYQKYSLNLAKNLIEDLNIEGAMVLDVGCGRGGACHYVASYFKPSKVYGLDYSNNNILFCQKNYDLKTLTFIQGDAHQLPFNDESYDLLLNIESSHCYPSFSRFFFEAHRVLKSKGVFCFADAMSKGKVKEAYELIKDLRIRILKERDITKNVIRAIQLDTENMRFFFNDMIQQKKGDKSLLENLYKSITGPVLENYMRRIFSYRQWILQK